MFNIKDFKVGDKVRVVSEATGKVRPGTIGEIVSINSSPLNKEVCVKFPGGFRVYFYGIVVKDVIEKVTNEPQHPKDKLVVYIQGTSVVAKYIREDKTSVEAVAKCNPEDTFDFLIGAQVALKRLVNKLGKKEVISEAALKALRFETTISSDAEKIEVIKEIGGNKWQNKF